MIEPNAAPAENESMEGIFEKNLRHLSTVEVEMEESKGVASSGKFKIDIMDGLGDEELEEPQDLNDDEKLIKQNIKKNNFESIFGIEGEESKVSSDLRKSRDFFAKKSSSKLRTSIASKFFLRKDTESES